MFVTVPCYKSKLNARNFILARQPPFVNFSKPEPVSLGGVTHHIKSECIFFGIIEGYHVHVKARIIDELGVDEEGKRIEVLFGALAMQEWGIRLLLVEEKLDLSCYPKEFVEY